MIYIAIVLAIVAALAFAVATFAPKDEPEVRGGFGVAGVVFLLLGGLFVLLASTVQVKATEVGVPVTFGKIGKPVQSGLHGVNPFTQVNKLPTRPVTVDQQVNAATSQAGTYTVDISARWATDRENASKLYQQARTGDEDAISNKIVSKSLSQAVNDVYAGFTNVEANEKRTTIAPEVARRLSILMLPYGIDVTDVNLRSSVPDDKTSDSIKALAAEQQKTKLADQARLTAIAEANARVETAKGVSRSAKELASLSKNEQDAAKVQAWERVIKDAAGRGVPVYTDPFGGTSPGVVVNSGK